MPGWKGGRVGGKGAHRAYPECLGHLEVPVWVLILDPIDLWEGRNEPQRSLNHPYPQLSICMSLLVSGKFTDASFGSHEGLWPQKKRPIA